MSRMEVGVFPDNYFNVELWYRFNSRRISRRKPPAPYPTHNASVPLGSAVRRRRQVQYHLALLLQLSFYDRLCILRALLLGRAALAVRR